jgi:hypothetical protein
MSLMHRFIALLLLLAYASAGTSVMPAVVTLLADLDGSHESCVQLSESRAQIVLHHRQSAFTPDLEDHERCLTRLLVRLCPSDREGDHELSLSHLSGGADLERKASVVLPAESLLLNAMATQQFQQALKLPRPPVISFRASSALVAGMDHGSHLRLTNVRLMI